MERNQIIEQLKQISAEDYAVAIYILAQPEIDNKILSVDFYEARLHQNLPKSIIDLFFPVIFKKLIQKEYDVEKYDPALTPDRNVVWKQSSDDVPFYKFFHNEVETAESIPRYDSDILPYDEIWAYWIKVYGKGNNFYLIKKVTSSKVIKTGGRLAIIFDSDIFQRLENDILTMDGTFDAIAFNDFLVFENKQNFEKALIYQQVKQTVAEYTLNRIDKLGFVEKFDQVRDFLKDDHHSINKLNSIKAKQYFKTLTFNDCKRIIYDYDVKIDIDEDNKKVKITSKAQAKHFIKVLNDDYLRSEMTNIKYAANSKENV